MSDIYSRVWRNDFEAMFKSKYSEMISQLIYQELTLGKTEKKISRQQIQNKMTDQKRERILFWESIKDSEFLTNIIKLIENCLRVYQQVYIVKPSVNEQSHLDNANSALNFYKNQYVAQVLWLQGDCYARQEKILDALSNYDQAITILEKVYQGANHPDFIKLYMNMADTKEKYIQIIFENSAYCLAIKSEKMTIEKKQCILKEIIKYSQRQDKQLLQIFDDFRQIGLEQFLCENLLLYLEANFAEFIASEEERMSKLGIYSLAQQKSQEDVRKQQPDSIENQQYQQQFDTRFSIGFYNKKQLINVDDQKSKLEISAKKLQELVNQSKQEKSRQQQMQINKQNEQKSIPENENNTNNVDLNTQSNKGNAQIEFRLKACYEYIKQLDPNKPSLRLIELAFKSAMKEISDERRYSKKKSIGE